MKVTILGSGTFYVSKKRSGQAYLLETDGKKILVDCGPGTLMRLSELGVNVEEITHVFLSHFHPDHSGDLFAFQMNFRLREFFDNPNKMVPVIYGPEGIEEFTKKLSYIYQLPAFDNYSAIAWRPYEPEIRLDGLTVRTFKVKHKAFGQDADAYALRFEAEGKTFVYSGDSIKCEGIEKAAENADVFICDASYTKGRGGAAHMDTLEIGEIAEQAGAKKVILTHFYPNTEGLDMAAEVQEKYSGEVVRGEDFMEIEL